VVDKLFVVQVVKYVKDVEIADSVETDNVDKEEMVSVSTSGETVVECVDDTCPVTDED
jgi:hypothetical protein